jgi:radical SAM superfamily enzyme YgiQ (UPF0313 family)
LPFPYSGKALELLPAYLEKRKIRERVGYEMTRGCPFSCRFCYTSILNNGHSSTKSVEKISHELAMLNRLGISEIDIHDNVLLGGNKDKIESTIKLLEQLKMKWCANLRIEMVSEDFLSKIKNAGCDWVYYGLESNNQETLNRIGKDGTEDRIKEVIDITSASKISPIYSIIVGLPFKEEEKNINAYLDLVEDIHKKSILAEIQIQSFVPFPGTPLYQNAISLGFVPPEKVMDWAKLDHFTTVSPWFSVPTLPRRLYIASFFAYRYKRHFGHFPVNIIFWPLHLISLMRFRYRFFSCYIEWHLFMLFQGTFKLINFASFQVKAVVYHLYYFLNELFQIRKKAA